MSDDRFRITSVQERQALGVEPTRRSGVEDDAAADRRSRPKDNPVAARRDHGLAQPQLTVVAVADNSSRHRGRSDVNGRRRRKIVTLQAHIQPKTDRKRSGLHQRLPSVQRTPLDSDQPDRHPLAGLGPVHALVVNLDRANAAVQPPGLNAQLVSHADRAGPKRPRHDRPHACQGEDAIDPQPRREVACDRPGTTGRTSERCAELREPLAGRCAHANDLRLGHELTGLSL